jgi:L-aminopeptidase/D-esterase-like protein
VALTAPARFSPQDEGKRKEYSMSQMNRRKFSHAVVSSAGVALLGHPDADERTDEVKVSDGSITDVPGVRVGHFTDSRRPTGCTAILFDGEASAGVDYDGSAPGSHLGVLLQPVSPIETIHGMLLTGGGPMGLAAVPGAVRHLEERKVGFDWGIPNVRVPIVVGAVIDDLALGDARIRPDAEAAYKACQSASPAPVEEGNVGVGAGATVGKMLASHGFGGMKSGLGTASLRLGDVVIGALVVVNAVGDIVDWRTGKILAGARRPDGKGFADIIETLKTLGRSPQVSYRQVQDPVLHSTTLAVVATNARFNKTAMTKIAMMASTGAARTINPYHTNGDGDSTFAVSTNKLSSDLGISLIGALAAELVSRAILRALKRASSIEGWPCCNDYKA